MLKISWKEKQTNENALQSVEQKRSLVDTISRRKKNLLGHIMRREGLLRNVIEEGWWRKDQEEESVL